MRLLKSYKVKQKAWIVPGLLVVFALYLAAPVLAQSSRDLISRLNRLENEIETLSRAVYRGEDPPPSASFSGDAGLQASAEVRLQQLEMEIRDMTGRLEEQNYQIRQMQEKLDKALADIELRFGDLEGTNTGLRSGSSQQGASYTTTAGRPSAPTMTTRTNDGYQWSSRSNDGSSGTLGTLSGASSSADTAAAAYENAFSLLKNGQYDRAETEFASFLASNPDHVLAGNAKYWLGETYYVRGEYDQAARIFAEGYQQYPKGSKAADNLLKLGMSLSASGNINDACTALGQVEKEFSNAGPVLRRAKQEMTRLGC